MKTPDGHGGAAAGGGILERLRSVAGLGDREPGMRPRHGVARLRRETVVAQGLEETFAFFADAGNLNLLTPSWVGFKILSPLPLDMRAGRLIDYRIRIHGVPVRWRTKIIVWDPPHRFVDLQVRGPYRWWHHEHRFEKAEGGTRVIDEVDYASPLWWIMHPLIVRRDVERIFDFRAGALQRELNRAGAR